MTQKYYEVVFEACSLMCGVTLDLVPVPVETFSKNLRMNG